MTEAEKPIEAPKTEETTFYTTERICTTQRKKFRHPHLPVENSKYSLFSLPHIFVVDANDPKYKCTYDLCVFELLDGTDLEGDQISYEDLLLQKMMTIPEERRAEFLAYQASVQKDSALWISQLETFWNNYRKEIKALEDDEFYIEYLNLIHKLSNKKMKEYADFTWEGMQISFVQLAIALYEMGVIKIDKDKYSVAQFTEAFASVLEIDIDVTKANNYKTKIKNKPTKKEKTVDETDLTFFNELKKVYSDWLLKERLK